MPAPGWEGGADAGSAHERLVTPRGRENRNRDLGMAPW